MKKRPIALLLCVLMVFSLLPLQAFGDGQFAITTSDGASVSAVTINTFEKVPLTASGVQASTVQWQIKYGESWINIAGATQPSLDLGYAMLANLLSGDVAVLRCAAGDVTSGEVVVTVDRAAVPTFDASQESQDVVVLTEAEVIAGDVPSQPSTDPAGETGAEVDLEALYNECLAAQQAVADAESALAASTTAHTAAQAAYDAAAAAEAEALAAYSAAQDSTDALTAYEDAAAYTLSCKDKLDAAAADVAAKTQALADAQAKFDELQTAFALAQNASLMTLEEPEAADEPTPQEDPEIKTYSVVINYVFTNGDQAANPYTATVAAGSALNITVNSPVVLGYEPDKASVTIEQTDIQADITQTVTYQPALVTYTVMHYQQNLNDDNYTLVETETKNGYTESPVGEGLGKAYEGFYSLLYDTTTKIAADGSTGVEIYYDRFYYLMNFDLDGGYGVEPIYARYGASISVGTPSKAGYTFGGWTLNGSTAELPSTMPATNTEYKAKWTTADTSFIVEYLLQDPDNEDAYNYVGSKTVAGTTGQIVDGSDYRSYDGVDVSMDEYEKKYSYYSNADANVTVKGDGTTVVHVYYDRTEFTLKFYYAMSSTNTIWGQKTTNYYVIGGSTYYFGTSASIQNTGDEVALLDQYMNTYSSHRGAVTEMPTLNATGSARLNSGVYTSGTDSSTVNNTSYTYYYITFSAKYGADLTDLWPSDVFNSVGTNGNSAASGWSGTEAYVSAWNGEHHVYYSQNNDNQTIKGKYAKLDYQLLWAETYGTPTDSTVTYLCFWENGADIGWSVPELYVYNVYVPVLDGQNTDGLSTRVYNGVTYYLRDQYNTVDNSTVSEQTQPAVDGFTANGYQYEPISGFDTSLYKEAYYMYFYYTRNTYSLDFYSDGVIAKSESAVPFESSLSAYQSYIPDYPDSLETGAYQFEGWYTSPNFTAETKVDLSTATMPSNNLALYAHWVPVTHTVDFYLTEDAANTIEGYPQQIVSHGSKITPVEDPVRGSYTFIGWFYMDNGVEKAFDIENMPVNKDLDLYGKWSSNTLVEYTISYALDANKDGVADTDAGGNVIYIAEETTGSGLAGSTKTFDAKAGAELNEGYQSGYFPVTNSHSMTFNIEGGNEFTFLYVPKEEVPYTVYYLTETDPINTLGTVEIDGKTYYRVVDDKSEETTDAIVTETFVAITGYMPDAYQKRLVLSATEADNVITFWYVKDDTHAPLHIVHYTQNISGDGYTVYQESTDINALIGQTYSEAPLTIDGFVHNPGAEGTLMSGTMTAAGLELKLYYDRIEYPYEFHFLEQGTDKVLANPVTGAARYQAQVAQNALPIPGYTLVSKTPQVINIAIEAPADVAKNNIRYFYYQENQVTINYEVVGPAGCGTVSLDWEIIGAKTGEPEGSQATPSSNVYKLVGWYLDEECTLPVPAAQVVDGKFTPVPGDDGLYHEATYYAKFEYNLTSMTITKTAASVYDSEDTFIFDISHGTETFSITLKAGQSVTINNVVVGEVYTVTERTAWSWRYTTQTPDQSLTVTANPAANTIMFVNTLANNQWLTDSSVNSNVFRSTK